MLAELSGSEHCKWYESVFGRDLIEPLDEAAYMPTGTLGQWLQHHYADRDYRFVTAEFGTYGPIRILAALRAENRAHHFGNLQSQNYQNAKLELIECFCPADTSWRQQAITAGLKIIRQSVNGLTN